MCRDIAFTIGILPRNVIGPRPRIVAGEEIHSQNQQLYPGDREFHRRVGAGLVERSNPVSHVSVPEIDTRAIHGRTVASGEISGGELRPETCAAPVAA